MCGRYTVGTEEENIRFREIIREANENFNPAARADAASDDGRYPVVRPNGEIRPGDFAPALRAIDGLAGAQWMQWGLRGFNGKTIINARGDSLEKPLFRLSANAFRCLLPAAGYFEWRKADGQKYRIQPETGGAFYLAGLYMTRETTPWMQGFEPRFVIVTRDAEGALSSLHTRMPLCFQDDERRDAWLTDARAARELIAEPPMRMLARAAGAEQLSIFD